MNTNAARLLIGAIPAIFIGAVFFSIHRAAVRARPRRDELGTLHFRHSIPLRWLSWFFLLGMPILLVGLRITEPVNLRVRDLMILAGVFVVLGLPLVWESTRFEIVAAGPGLDCRSPWRRRQFFGWAEIEEVGYSSSNHWFILHATRGRKFRVPMFIAGVGKFLELCEAHLPPSALSRARAGYAEVGRSFPE